MQQGRMWEGNKSQEVQNKLGNLDSFLNVCNYYKGISNLNKKGGEEGRKERRQGGRKKGRKEGRKVVTVFPLTVHFLDLPLSIHPKEIPVLMCFSPNPKPLSLLQHLDFRC